MAWCKWIRRNEMNWNELYFFVQNNIYIKNNNLKKICLFFLWSYRAMAMTHLRWAAKNTFKYFSQKNDSSFVTINVRYRFCVLHFFLAIFEKNKTTTTTTTTTTATAATRRSVRRGARALRAVSTTIAMARSNLSCLLFFACVSFFRKN